MDKFDAHGNVQVYEEAVDVVDAAGEDIHEDDGAAAVEDSVHLISSLQRRS